MTFCFPVVIYTIMSQKQIISLYSDGTYRDSDKIATWGYIIVKDGIEIHREKGNVTDKDSLSGWQVGAEIEAVMHGVEYCKNNNYLCDIYYDYSGVFDWVRDLFNQGKSWKAKKSYTKKYREYIINNKDSINSYIWVKGHSGNFYNEEVDSFIASR